VFLGKIKDAFDRNPQLQNLLLDDFFKTAVENCQVSFQRKEEHKNNSLQFGFLQLLSWELPSQVYLY